jgi:hypothetical protein
MSYTINLTNGSTLIPGGLSDGTVDTTHSSLTLIGRDYAGYGQFLNENFIYLLENFANNASPANPLKGQLWWDTTNNVLKVYSGTSWKISTGATSSPASAPPGDLSALGGDLWFDTTNSQLKVYSGSQWIVVGPYTASTVLPSDFTGAAPAVVVDTSSGSHVVIQFKINGTTYAIFSKDTFASSLTGFATIKAGINFSTTASPSWVLSNQDVNATASTLVQRDGTGSINVVGINASGTITAGTVVATSISSPSGTSTFTGNLVGNVQSATTGTFTNIYTQGITASSGYTGTILTSNQPNITTLGNVFNLNTNGNLNITGVAYLNGQPVATSGAATSSLIPAANVSYDIGSSSAWWRNIYGTAIHAQYADLAERFHADAEYAPGTVVEMGGVNEVTQVVEELSEKVFGVISTNAAYLMNSSAGNDATHPPIAMSGRVPVRVIGMIAKGERLVSAGNGIARAGKAEELTPWNVIGRSLVDKNTENEGIIEAIVKINS